MQNNLSHGIVARLSTARALVVYLLCGLIWAGLNTLALGHPHLEVDFSSPVAGASHCFPHREKGQYDGTSMRSHAISVGANHCVYELEEYGDELRWDPPDAPGPFLIKRMAIRTWFVSRRLDGKGYNMLRHVQNISTSDAGDVINTDADAFDPQLGVTIPQLWLTVMHEIQSGILAILFTVLLILAWRWHERQAGDNALPVVFPLAILAAVYAVIPSTPVDSGAGWDGGTTYLPLVIEIGRGHWPIHLSLYQSLRLLPFLPLYPIAGFDLSKVELVEVMRWWSCTLGLAGVLLFYGACLRLGITALRALWLSCGMVLAWPVIVMPAFYPVLGDHAAVFVSVAFMYAWISRRLNFQLVLLGVSCFVMPVLPVALAPFVAFDRRTAEGLLGAVQPRALHGAMRIGIASIAALLAWMVYAALQQLPDADLTNRSGEGLCPGLLDYRSMASSLSAALFGLVAFASLSAIAQQTWSYWRVVIPRSILVALVGFAGLMIAWAVSSPTPGLGGPPFVHNLLIQAQAAPLKPIVAHAYHNGPVFILALGAILAGSLARTGLPLLFAACVLPLVLLLVLGSESRQFVFLLPICLLGLGVSRVSSRTIVVFLIGNVFMLLPALDLGRAMQSLRLSDDFLSPSWQLYFGRQGPWMGWPAYTYALGVLACTMIAALAWKVSGSAASESLSVRSTDGTMPENRDNHV